MTSGLKVKQTKIKLIQADWLFDELVGHIFDLKNDKLLDRWWVVSFCVFHCKTKNGNWRINVTSLTASADKNFLKTLFPFHSLSLVEYSVLLICFFFFSHYLSVFSNKFFPAKCVVVAVIVVVVRIPAGQIDSLRLFLDIGNVICFGCIINFNGRCVDSWWRWNWGCWWCSRRRRVRRWQHLCF